MWRDDACLLDMLGAARKIRDHGEGVTWEQFRDDEVVQQAMMRWIQIIGEAARMVSEEFREGHPEIPWRQIIGMRHRLVHEYFRIIPEKVWNAIVYDIPPLIVHLEPLVPPDQPAAEDEQS